MNNKKPKIVINSNKRPVKCGQFGQFYKKQPIVPNHAIKVKPFPYEDILIYREGGIGDVLMCTAVAHEIKNQGHRVAFKTKYTELLQNNPDIDLVLPLNQKSPENFRTIDLFWACESKSVNAQLGKCSDHDYMNTPRINILFDAAGMISPAQPQIRYCATEKEIEDAKNILNHKPTIIYSLTSTSPIRTWPIDNVIPALEKISAKYPVAVVGITNHWKHTDFYKRYHEWVPGKNNILDLTNQTSLRQLAALIIAGGTIISGDTGSLHLAAACNVPCLGLFGNIEPRLRTIYYPLCQTIFSNAPCAKNCGDRPVVQDKICPDRKMCQRGKIGAFCMHLITPDEVVDKVMKMVNI